MAGQNKTSDFKLDDRAFERALNIEMKRAQFNSKRELVALGKSVENEAIQYSPVDEGDLKASWFLTSGEDAEGPWVDIGNTSDHATYSEFGTRPHQITIKSKKVLANQVKGEIFGKTVNHPGTSAQPALRPALLEQTAAWRPRITEE